MAVRKIETLVALAAFVAVASAPAHAQSAAGSVVTPTLPAPGTGGIVTVPAASTPAEQLLFNYVSFPVGTTVGPGGPQTLEYRFRMPIVFNNPMVPTDVTGVGGSLGHAQGLRERILGPDRNVLPDSRGVIVARDNRYQFTGRWMPWSTQQVAVLSTAPRAITSRVITMPAVIPTVSIPEFRDGRPDIPVNAEIMPTAGASYSVSNANEITLTNGALLVKGGNQPLWVLAPLAGDTAVVRIARGAFVMISNMDGKVNIANLADTRSDSVVGYLTDRNRKTYGEMPVRIGYMLEVYPNAAPEGENRLVAHTVLDQVRLTNGYTVETLRLNYPRTFKRFNLTRALSADDLSWLIKSAAAVAYMDSQREVNGLTPVAQ